VVTTESRVQFSKGCLVKLLDIGSAKGLSCFHQIKTCRLLNCKCNDKLVRDK